MVLRIEIRVIMRSLAGLGVKGGIIIIYTKIKKKRTLRNIEIQQHSQLGMGPLSTFGPGINLWLRLVSMVEVHSVA